MSCRRHLVKQAQLWGAVSVVAIVPERRVTQRAIAKRPKNEGVGARVRSRRRPRRPLPPMQEMIRRTAALAYKELLAWALASVRISPRGQEKVIEPANTFYVTSARRSLQ